MSDNRAAERFLFAGVDRRARRTPAKEPVFLVSRNDTHGTVNKKFPAVRQEVTQKKPYENMEEKTKWQKK